LVEGVRDKLLPLISGLQPVPDSEADELRTTVRLGAVSSYTGVLGR
jgi:hypothetical protein